MMEIYWIYTFLGRNGGIKRLNWLDFLAFLLLVACFSVGGPGEAQSSSNDIEPRPLK